MRLLRITAVLAGAAGLAACASQGPVANTLTASAAPSAAATTSAAPAASASATVSPGGAASAGSARNLTLTTAVRAQLVAAAAKLNGLPATAYLGLVAGESYYGFDPATSTYWAGGALVPSPDSQQAEVSVQDDGGYYIFQQPAGGSWTAASEGLAGIEGAACSVHIPPALVALWHWPAGACHPPGI